MQIKQGRRMDSDSKQKGSFGNTIRFTPPGSICLPAIATTAHPFATLLASMHEYKQALNKTLNGRKKMFIQRRGGSTEGSAVAQLAVSNREPVRCIITAAISYFTSGSAEHQRPLVRAVTTRPPLQTTSNCCRRGRDRARAPRHVAPPLAYHTE